MSEAVIKGVTVIGGAMFFVLVFFGSGGTVTANIPITANHLAFL